MRGVKTQDEALLDSVWLESYLCSNPGMLHVYRKHYGLPHYVVGKRKYLYRKSEIDRWLATRARNNGPNDK